MRNKIKCKRQKLAEIKSQVEQLKVKRKVAELAVSGRDDGIFVTAVFTARTSVSTVNTSTDLSGLSFGGKNPNKHKK